MQPSHRRTIGRWCLALVAVLATAGSATEKASVPTASREPSIKAQSAVLMDAGTGQVLWSLNPHVRRPMASTTKVMTTMLALEQGNPDDVVTAPKGIDKIQESSLHLKPGEKLTLRELLYASMIRSANDAAALVGRHVAGSTPEFVKRMNARAAELGLANTQFKNANGLNAAGHFSTAYDLAMLTRHAQAVPGFNEICATRSFTITSRKTGDRLLKSRAKFLLNYPGADGVKSGYTRQAGFCYIGSATSEGRRLISVVLKSSNAGEDTKALMDFGFKAFEKSLVAAAGSRIAEAPVPGGRPSRIGLIVKEDLHACVRRGAPAAVPEVFLGSLTPPIARYARVGSVVASSNGVALTRAPLVAEEEVRAGTYDPLGALAVIAGGPLAFAAYLRSGGTLRPRRRSVSRAPAQSATGQQT